MYKLIIDLLNNFLNYIHIPDTPLNPDVFQGVFVKKLSNQNIIKEKRRISANNTILKMCIRDRSVAPQILFSTFHTVCPCRIK